MDDELWLLLVALLLLTFAVALAMSRAV